MPYTPEIGLREYCVNKTNGWSEWLLIMGPHKYGQKKKRREGQSGYRVSTIDENKQDECGIYELGLSRNRSPLAAVYIGKSCRGRISARIQEYCSFGSHIADFINKAIDKGYNIYARYKLSINTTVEEDEETYLKRYDYAWNVKSNGAPREYYPQMV